MCIRDRPELGEGGQIDTSIPADPNVKNYSYTVVGGEVYYRETVSYTHLSAQVISWADAPLSNSSSVRSAASAQLITWAERS